MKYLSKIVLLLLVTATLFQSCKKDDNQIVFDGGTPPTLSANRASNSVVPIAYINRELEAIKFMWTNPNYKLTTGISSQNVEYKIQIDTLGANFTSVNQKEFSLENDLSRIITQGELNDALVVSMKIDTSVVCKVQVRIKSRIKGVNLDDKSTDLYSNAFTFTTKTYPTPPKVDLPTSGELYLVGSASPGGWSNPVPTPSQKFTQVSPTLYELTIAVTGGQSYLFLPVNGSWADKYGFDGANNANDVNADNLKRGGGDMKAPAASGNYKISVDFQRGRFTLTKL